MMLVKTTLFTLRFTGIASIFNIIDGGLSIYRKKFAWWHSAVAGGVTGLVLGPVFGGGTIFGMSFGLLLGSAAGSVMGKLEETKSEMQKQQDDVVEQKRKEEEAKTRELEMLEYQIIRLKREAYQQKALQNEQNSNLNPNQNSNLNPTQSSKNSAKKES